MRILPSSSMICLRGVATGFVPPTKMCAYATGVDACQVSWLILPLRYILQWAGYRETAVDR